jgi:hypothetical protein
MVAGERVTLQTSIGQGAAGQTYEYVGSSTLTDVHFAQQDFSDSQLWKRVLGEPGMVYFYTGSGETINLAKANYNDASRWTAFDLGGALELGLDIADAVGSGDGSTAVGGLVSRNSLDGVTQALVNETLIQSEGEVVIDASRNGRVVADDTSDVAAGGTGVGLVVVTNNLMGGVSSALTQSDVTTIDSAGEAGDVSVTAKNTALISAHLSSQLKAKTSVGVTLAFNSLGYANTNLLDDLAALVQRAENVTPGAAFFTHAVIDASGLDLSGKLTVDAHRLASFDALIESAALGC